ncbi:MAG: hypothetical protein K8U57_36035 [Planctomycetes bacterium]|nr:hypothetical protein [Planctomycetota bacterium]
MSTNPIPPGAQHGQDFPCPACHNPNTRLDIDTPDGHALPEGEWTWWNAAMQQWECSECWLK